MADQKISQLNSLTGANTASGDLVTIVDISDTTMGASGTNKKMTLTEFQASPVSAGTANGVVFLNGSKVETSGSALTFDGTYFTANGLRLAGTDVTNTIYQSTGALGITTGTAAGITFATNLTTRMTLDGSGNLGIGRSPAYKLDVYLSGTGSPAIASSNDNIVTILQSSGSSQGNVGTITSHPLVFLAGNTEHMRLDTSGNLGLNTTAFGTSAAGVLSLGTGTAPTTGPADTVQLFSVDRSAGNTIPAVRCEGSGVTNAGITSTTVTHKIAMQVNGTIYYLLATTNAT
jgi:hypothetical protein